MLGVKRALVVHGNDGLDEITTSGPTKVGEVRNEWVRVYEITPEQFGMERAPISELTGGDVHANAEIIREILEGKKSPKRDVVVMNAAAALVAAGRADDIHVAVPMAEQSVDSGAAKEKLEKLVAFTSKIKVTA
jgi:anthranilate phosphoribosyltransferase